METSSATETRRIIVIGAGVAGLAAARQAQHQCGFATTAVTVLEARDRVGGRIWSDRFSDGTVIDLGAQWVHGVCPEHPIASLAKDHPEWGELVETDWESCPDFQLGTSAEMPEEWREKSEELFEQTWSLMESSRCEKEDSARRPGEKDLPLWDGLQQLGCADFDWSRLTEQEQFLLRWRWARETEWIYAAPMEELSFRWWDDDLEFEGPDCVWPKGYTGFMCWLSEGLDIRLGMRAVAVVQQTNGVAVHCLKDGKAIVEHANLVIVALPLGVLKTGKVQFVPPLSAEKNKSIHAVGMGLLNKVALRFDERFWPDDISGFDRVAVRKEQVTEKMEAHEWVFLPDCAGAPVAIAYFCCEMAKRAESTSEADLTLRCLEILAETFDMELTSLEASLREVKRSRWQADEYAQGSYSYLPVGTSPAHRRTLAEPHGDRVLFAGEHVRNDYPSTVHGAYLSGCKACEDALKFLSGELPKS